MQEKKVFTVRTNEIEYLIPRVYLLAQGIILFFSLLLLAFHLVELYGFAVILSILSFLHLFALFIFLFIRYRRQTVTIEKIELQRSLSRNIGIRQKHYLHIKKLENEIVNETALEKQRIATRISENTRVVTAFNQSIDKSYQDEVTAINNALKKNQEIFLTNGLSSYSIIRDKIPGIGKITLEKLINNGITNAYKVLHTSLFLIDGIKENQISSLLYWSQKIQNQLIAIQPKSLPENQANEIRQRFSEFRDNTKKKIIAEESLKNSDIEKIQNQSLTNKSSLNNDLNQVREEFLSVSRILANLQISQEAYSNITFPQFIYAVSIKIMPKTNWVKPLGVIGLILFIGIPCSQSFVFRNTISEISIASYTPTFTLTATQTSTLTPTITISPTITETPTITLTFTITPTFTMTSTTTRTPTLTRTPTQTITIPNTINSCLPTNTSRQVGVVVGVTDGDTINVQINGQVYPVRLIGINAPESGAYFASSSTYYLSQLVYGRTVTLIRDVSDTDVYDRLLRYIIVGNSFVNYEMVIQGYALATTYPPDNSCANILQNAENSAHVSDLGIWMPTPEPNLYTFSSSGSTGGCNCYIDYDCADFSSHAAAQSCFDACGGNNWSRLDRDGDGLACEALP